MELMTCNQIGCNNVATHKVYWPGSKPLETCKIHAIMAQKIANGIMGLYIQIEELPYESAREGQSNSQDPEK